MQGDDDILGPRAAQGHSRLMVAAELGRVGHDDLVGLLNLLGSEAGGIQREDAVLVVERQRYISREGLALDGKGSGCCLLGIGSQVQSFRNGPDCGGGDGGLQALDNRLFHIESQVTGVEGIQRKVSITVAAPTPIDMISVVGSIIAIHVEGMARPTSPAVVIIGTIDQGTSLAQFGLEQLGPLLIGVVWGLVAKVVGYRLIDNLSIIVIAEEFHGTQDVLGLGSTLPDVVIHVFYLADVAHEPCDGFGLGIVVNTSVLVKHIVPVKRDGGQCRHLGVNARRNIGGDLGRGILGILPVVEHHRQRRGRAASQAVSALIDGTMVVVWLILVPFGGEQRSDRGRQLGIPAEFRALNGQTGMGLQKFELSLVGTQPVLHVLGHAGHVQRTVTMGQNHLGAVFTRHDDETLLGVKDVIDRDSRIYRVSLDMGNLEVSLGGSSHPALSR